MFKINEKKVFTLLSKASYSILLFYWINYTNIFFDRHSFTSTIFLHLCTNIFYCTVALILFVYILCKRTNVPKLTLLGVKDVYVCVWRQPRCGSGSHAGSRYTVMAADGRHCSGTARKTCWLFLWEAEGISPPACVYVCVFLRYHGQWDFFLWFRRIAREHGGFALKLLWSEF